MRYESTFMIGLAAAVAFLIALLALFTLAIGVTLWRNVIRKPKPDPMVTADFERIIEAARRGGAQVGDTD